MKLLSFFLLFFLPFAVSAQSPPAGQPVSPADNDSCRLTTVQLCAYVHDAGGDSLHVRFYFRPSMGAPRDFTLMGLPDTQYYTGQLNNATNNIFKQQTAWIVAHKDSLNIAHVCHFGDCVQNGDYNNDPTEWERADTAMRIIEDPLTTNLPEGISYSMNVGNHDQWPTGDPNGTTTFFNQYFGSARFGSRAYWGGMYDTSADNSFQLFSASGYDFLVVSLEYDLLGNTQVLAWADSIVQAYPNRRAIIVSHYLLEVTGAFGPQGALVYQALRHNTNLSLLLCGHVSGEARRTNVYAGDTTYTLLADYQGRPIGGSGWMRIMTFSPEFNTLSVKTYSPFLGTYETDTNSAFVLPFFLYPQTPYVQIGDAYVDSAGMACITVSGLSPDSVYDWYATIDDGTTTVTTAFSRFGTFGSAVSMSAAADTVCINSAPVALSGTPPGGTFSGSGVTGNTMDPSQAGAGMSNVTYTYVNAAGCANSSSLGIYVDPCTGVEENMQPASIVFYHDGMLEMELQQAANVRVFDAAGKLVLETNVKEGKSAVAFSAPAGIYFYRLTNNDQRTGEGKLVVPH